MKMANLCIEIVQILVLLNDFDSLNRIMTELNNQSLIMQTRFYMDNLI